MEIDEITEEELSMMLWIRWEQPIFVTGTPPPGHRKYAHVKMYIDSTKRVLNLERMGFVKNITREKGPHIKMKLRKDLEEGYEHEIYSMTDLGFEMWGRFDPEQFQDKSVKQ